MISITRLIEFIAARYNSLSFAQRITALLVILFLILALILGLRSCSADVDEFPGPDGLPHNPENIEGLQCIEEFISITCTADSYVDGFQRSIVRIVFRDADGNQVGEMWQQCINESSRYLVSCDAYLNEEGKYYIIENLDEDFTCYFGTPFRTTSEIQENLRCWLTSLEEE